ncbi:MAG: CinA family protein [Lachnospiraceae bacterium]|nr:CinA family protein [Lachnospiraceae bacterium]
MTVEQKYETLTKALITNHITISTMESCTSGSIASLITDTEGASAVFEGSFVTYSNQAKIMCGVPSSIIDTYGVYSSQTAEAMALCALIAFQTDVAVGVTGSFGNIDPANEDSVPGHVYYSIANRVGCPYSIHPCRTPQGKAFRCPTVAKVPLASKLADGTLARCYTKKETETFSIVLDSLQSRYEYKRKLADDIADRLLDLILRQKSSQASD